MPRVTATSLRVILRGGSGSRAFSPESIGRSAAKFTSSSGLPAMARMQPMTARLNGSVGPSRPGGASFLLLVAIASFAFARLQLITTLAVDSGSSLLNARW